MHWRTNDDENKCRRVGGWGGGGVVVGNNVNPLILYTYQIVALNYIAVNSL